MLSLHFIGCFIGKNLINKLMEIGISAEGDSVLMSIATIILNNVLIKYEI